MSDAAIAYSLNCFLNTDCWYDEQVKTHRKHINSGYIPAITTDERGVDTPAMTKEKGNSFMTFVNDNYDGEVFTFDEISLFGIFCSQFIGNGLDSIHVNVMVYHDDEGVIESAVMEDGSWFQRFDFQVTGAEEYNALEEFVGVLHELYLDWGHTPKWHIATTKLDSYQPGWFFTLN
jgi:hypothetical protein